MRREGPKLAFQALPWLSPNRIACAACAAMGAACVVPVLRGIRDLEREVRGGAPAWAIVVASTALLSIVLVRRALRAKGWESATFWCVFGGMFFGAVNAGLSFAGVTMLHQLGFGAAVGAFLAGFFIGGIYGVPLGFVFGSAYALVVDHAVCHRLKPTHEGPDRVLMFAGVLLACVAVVVQGPRTDAFAWFPTVLFAVGIVSGLAGMVRMWGRRIFLRRVADGRLPGYRLEVVESGSSVAGLLPYRSARRGEGMVRLLVATPRPSTAPYRDASVRVPLALVPWRDA